MGVHDPAQGDGRQVNEYTCVDCGGDCWKEGFRKGDGFICRKCSDYDNAYANGFTAGAEAMREAAARACDRWAKIAQGANHDASWPRDLAEFIREHVRIPPSDHQAGKGEG